MKLDILNNIGIIKCQTKAQFYFCIELVGSILDEDEFNYNDFNYDDEISISNNLLSEITAFDFIQWYIGNQNMSKRGLPQYYTTTTRKSEQVTDPIVDEVCSDLQQRSAIGIKKYNTTLFDNDLTALQWAQHAYEEQLDNCNYMKSLIKKLENGIK